MDKYTREVEARPEESKSKPTDNEIRVTTLGKMRSYITYATKKLQDGKCDEITLKAMGKAINKTVTIAEIIKRRIPKLHQITQINSTLIQEKYVPREDGLDPVFTTRHVSSILISLLTREPDTSTVGYQPPIPEEDVKSTPVRTNTFPNPSRPANIGRGRNMRGRRGRGRRPLKPFSNNSKGDNNQDTRAQDTQSQIQNPASQQQQYPQSTQTQNQPYQQQNQPYQQQNQPYQQQNQSYQQQNQPYQQQNQSYQQQNQPYQQQNQPYQQYSQGQRSFRGGRGRRGGGRGGIGRNRRGRGRGGPRNTTGDTRQN